MQKLISIMAIASLAACAQMSSKTSDSTPAGSAPPAAEATSVATAPSSTPAAAPTAPAYGSPMKVDPDPKDVAKYKTIVANKIASSNSMGMKNDAPRPADANIKGLTVVGLQVRQDGQIDKAWIVRPSGDDTLDRKALESVKAASPLPSPTEDVMLGRGYAVFAESWIHRTDGHFQLVSKTTQGDPNANVASKASGVKRTSTAAVKKTSASSTAQ